MIDREKVIKGLEFHKNTYCFNKTEELCPYFSQEDCGNALVSDALALLKEQGAVEPDTNSAGTCTCGNCGETVGYYPAGCKTPKRLCRFCPECGKAVKWDG